MFTYRAIVGARVSSYKDLSKTSHLTQREAGVSWAAQRNIEVVGYFEDLDISAGKFTPWERPDLGPWLSNTPPVPWNTIIFAKGDRAFRSMKDASDFAYWCEKTGKRLIFTDDSQDIDFTPAGLADDPLGFNLMIKKMFLQIIAMGAEMELRRITGRMLDSHKALKKTDRWAGGQPPFGYRIVKHPVKGKTLEIDPETSAIVKRAAELVMGGKSLYETALILTREECVTPAQYGARNSSRPNRKRPIAEAWNATTLGRILQNPATMGWKVSGPTGNSRKVRGNDGQEIRIADPIFSELDWDILQETIAMRRKVKERVRGAGPLLGIVICSGCDRRLNISRYKRGDKEFVYYRCPAKGNTAGPRRCGKGYSFPADKLTELIDEWVSEVLADEPLTIRKLIPGEDHTAELKRVIKAMDEMRQDRIDGRFDYPGGDEEYKTVMDDLATQRRTIAAMPQRDDEWINVPTGRTIGDAYNAADRDGKRVILMGRGVTVRCAPNNNYHFHFEEDGKERVQRVVADLESAVELDELTGAASV